MTIAEMLILVGDNPGRIRSEAALAKLCGVCPIPASSGKTHRFRLNRGGSRQANAALYRVAIVRMRSHEPTLAYVRKRTKEGKSKSEIIRCLKRYIVREIFTHLCRSETVKTRVDKYRSFNTAMETFFKTIKAELIWRDTWETRRKAEIAIFEYINGFYNPRRRHSTLGWKSPVAFERKMA